LDLSGLFYSTDLDERLKSADTFNFVSAEDRGINLPDEYSFILITDTHINDDSRGLGREALEGVIIDTDKFIVNMGDITNDGEKEFYDKFVEFFGDLSIPCFPAIGNHDLFFNGWAVWKSMIGSTRYTAGTGSTKLIFLDSASAYLGGAQLRWLDEQLKSGEEHIFVFTHNSLIIQNTVNFDIACDWYDEDERALALSLLSGRAEAVFSGHLHIRCQESIGGTRFLTLEDYKASRTYCRVFVSPNGLHFEFKKMP
jgi:3',5'-cyclic AMP phosphodiesterase CpdA